ncbi:glycosyltransferase family 8 protein [uncultured Bacteroides sp.]|uniref:glycosyltransferase family 8 protein n=1 Tax=uncultured Bacteroides sp. TaxID=162156 RepID=UPI0026358496|nr:glycosyltransferase family 8 protein [uncultured Bacteroides sp.]
MNKIPIVFAFDNNLVLPACICIFSLLKNANSDTFYEIYILNSVSHPIDKRKIDKITDYFENCSINYREIDDTFDSSFEIRGITTPAYYRLLIPEIIPEHDKIIYSDVDVIFRSDLSDVFNMDLTGYYMAGVDNASALRPLVQKYVKESLGIDCKYGHYYSGNLIINSSLIRKDNIMSIFRDLAKKKFHQQDMDIINIACYGKIKPIPPYFCLTNYLTELIVSRKTEMLRFFSKEDLDYALKQGIVHYNGQKPWKGYCVNFDIWWEYYRKSPFFDEKFYFDFFYNKLNELDQLSLWKRIKILIRYFVYGKRRI